MISQYVEQKPMKIYLYKYINSYFADIKLPTPAVMEEVEWMVVRYLELDDLREYDRYNDDLTIPELLDSYASEQGELINKGII
jgi:hypothetical protein